MTGLFLTLAFLPGADPDRADVELAIDHYGRTERLGLLVALDRGPLADRQRELLGDWRPTGDGSDPLERLAPDGRLLRVVVVPPSPHSARLSAALRSALDRDGDGRLTGAEVRAAEEVLLKRFDVDGNGCLIPLEIVPDLLTAEPPPAAKVTVRAVPAGKAPPAETLRLSLGAAVRTERTVGGVRCDGFSPAPGERPAVPKALREADRERFERVAREVATLTVRPQPRGLFELLDADGDGQLSTRELRRAADRLTAGDLAPPEATVSLTLMAGTSATAGPPLVPVPVPRRGPVWFRASDRNGDGDLSRDEFIGTGADFKAYDADGDGLISADEAEAGDRKREGGRR